MELISSRSFRSPDSLLPLSQDSPSILEAVPQKSTVTVGARIDQRIRAKTRYLHQPEAPTAWRRQPKDPSRADRAAAKGGVSTLASASLDALRALLMGSGDARPDALYSDLRANLRLSWKEFIVAREELEYAPFDQRKAIGSTLAKIRRDLAILHGTMLKFEDVYVVVSEGKRRQDERQRMIKLVQEHAGLAGGQDELAQNAFLKDPANALQKLRLDAMGEQWGGSVAELLEVRRQEAANSLREQTSKGKILEAQRRLNRIQDALDQIADSHDPDRRSFRGSATHHAVASMSFPNEVNSAAYPAWGAINEGRSLATLLEVPDASGIAAWLSAGLALYDSLFKEKSFATPKERYDALVGEVEQLWHELRAAGHAYAKAPPAEREALGIVFGAIQVKLELLHGAMQKFEDVHCFSKSKRERRQAERQNLIGLAKRYAARAAGQHDFTHDAFVDDLAKARPRLALEVTGDDEWADPATALNVRRENAAVLLRDATSKEETLAALQELNDIATALDLLKNGHDPAKWSRLQILRVRDAMLQPMRAVLDAGGGAVNMAKATVDVTAVGAAIEAGLAVASSALAVAAAPFTAAMAMLDIKQAGKDLAEASNVKLNVLELMDKVAFAALAQPFGAATDKICATLLRALAERLDTTDRAQLVSRMRMFRGDANIPFAAAQIALGAAALAGVVASSAFMPVLAAPAAVFLVSVGVDLGLKKHDSVRTHAKERAAYTVSDALSTEQLKRLLTSSAVDDPKIYPALEDVVSKNAPIAARPTVGAVLDEIVGKRAVAVPHDALMVHEKAMKLLHPAKLVHMLRKHLRRAKIDRNEYLAVDFITRQLQEAAYAPDDGTDNLLPVETFLNALGMSNDKLAELRGDAARLSPRKHLLEARKAIAELFQFPQHADLDMPPMDTKRTREIIEREDDCESLLQKLVHFDFNAGGKPAQEMVDRIERIKLKLLSTYGITDADLRALADVMDAEETSGLLDRNLCELLLHPREILAPREIASASKRSAAQAKQGHLEISDVRRVFKAADKAADDRNFVEKQLHLHPPLSHDAVIKDGSLRIAMMNRLCDLLIERGALKPRPIDSHKWPEYNKKLSAKLLEELTLLKDHCERILMSGSLPSHSAGAAKTQQLWSVIDELLERERLGQEWSRGLQKG